MRYVWLKEKGIQSLRAEVVEAVSRLTWVLGTEIRIYRERASALSL